MTNTVATIQVDEHWQIEWDGDFGGKATLWLDKMGVDDKWIHDPADAFHLAFEHVVSADDMLLAYDEAIKNEERTALWAARDTMVAYARAMLKNDEIERSQRTYEAACQIDAVDRILGTVAPTVNMLLAKRCLLRAAGKVDRETLMQITMDNEVPGDPMLGETDPILADAMDGRR